VSNQPKRNPRGLLLTLAVGAGDCSALVGSKIDVSAIGGVSQVHDEATVSLIHEPDGS